jgi:hypothetical protein
MSADPETFIPLFHILSVIIQWHEKTPSTTCGITLVEADLRMILRGHPVEMHKEKRRKLIKDNLRYPENN